MKMSVSYQAEKIILFFYISLNVISFLAIIKSGYYIGDPFGESYSLPNYVSYSMLLLNSIVYIGFYYVYKYITSKNEFFRKQFQKKLELILFLGTSIGWLGFILFDYGKAEHQSSLSFGFLFRVIPYSVFWLVYVSVVDKINKKSVFLILYFVALKLVMGWSGILLALFWVLFIKIFNSKKRTLFVVVLTTFLLILLYLLAPYVYYMKYYIRYDGNFIFNYDFLLSKLMARMSTIQNLLFTYQHANDFSHLYSRFLTNGYYFFEPFLSVVPRSLLGISGQNLETIYVHVVTGVFNPGVIFYLSLAGKFIVLFNNGFYDMFNFLFVVSFVFVSIVILLRKTFNAAANPYIFYIMLQFILSGSLEELSYTLYGVLFIFIFTRVKFR